MKVLLLVSGFPSIKNPNKGSFNLTTAKLLRTKHDVSILQIRAWKPPRKFITYSTFESFEIVHVSFPLFKLWGVNSVFLNHFFLRLLINFNKRKMPKSDIIHSVGAGLTSFGASIIAKILNNPLIIQYTGSDVNFYLSKYKNKKEIKSYIKSANYHVFNSDQLKTIFSELFPGIKNKKVIYRGINLIENRNIDKKEKKPVILYLGGLTSDDFGRYPNNLKGGVTLLKAWKRLDSSENLSNIKLLFGGPNSRRYLDFLNISKLNYPNSFEIIHELSKLEVKKYMEKSNIVIIPSLFEGLPNVAFEALAFGNMVIGSNVGGIPEVINDQCGILIEPNNEDEIIKVIKYIIQNTQKVTNLSKGAKLRIKSFDRSIFLEDYSLIYKNSIAD